MEVARPEKGVNIRVRCWWISNRPVLKQPVVVLVQMKLDPLKGEHTVEITLKSLKDNSLRVVREKFDY